jgi:hypothetical protein
MLNIKNLQWSQRLLEVLWQSEGKVDEVNNTGIYSDQTLSIGRSRDMYPTQKLPGWFIKLLGFQFTQRRVSVCVFVIAALIYIPESSPSFLPVL